MTPMEHGNAKYWLTDTQNGDTNGSRQIAYHSNCSLSLAPFLL